MISWMRRRLTYANVLVTAVAFLVLAGTSVAQDAVSSAATLITGKQVKNGTITGKDVKNHSLTKKDFKGSVRGPQGIQGPQGLQGIQGLKGDKGDTGTPGATSVKVRTASKSISGTSTRSTCSARRASVRSAAGGEAYPRAARLISSRPGVTTVGSAAGSAGDLRRRLRADRGPDARRVARSGRRGRRRPVRRSRAYVICAAP